MGVNITTIVYLRVLIIQIGSTIVLMVVEAQGYDIFWAVPSDEHSWAMVHRYFRYGPMTSKGSQQSGGGNRTS